MAYDPSSLSSPINQVRHLIGDTDPSEPKLGDGEIQYELDAVSGNIRLAAAASAFALETRYLDMVDVSDGELRVSGSAVAEKYHNLGMRLADPSSVGLPSTTVPFAGGISRSDKESRDENEDRVPPFFDRPHGRSPRDIEQDWEVPGT